MPDSPEELERRLREAEAEAHRLHAVLDAIPAPIFYKDAAGVYLGCNVAFEQYMGQPRERIVGARVSGVAPPDLAEVYRQADRALLAGGGVQIYEAEVAYADGSRRTVLFEKSVFRDAAGQVAGLAGTMLDVSAQRRAEADLRQALVEREAARVRLEQADRLASIGTLAAGVAHELNNPLTFVLSNLAFVAEELERLLAGSAPGDPAAVEDLVRAVEEARQGADRMRVIVRDLRALSRADEAPHGPVEVARVLEYAIGLAWSQVRGRARLVRDFGGVPRVRGSEARLGQVFLNLLVNAAQAIPEGDADRNEIRVAARATGDGRVAVEVTDTGSGLTEEARRRLFDPFFTTKPAGMGTGLGLWVCHSLVRAHGGEIEVEGVPGRGTTFRVLLPAVAAGEPDAPARRRTPVAATRRRLLVVDDEPFVGATLRRQLAAEYEVEVVASGEEALRRLSAGLPFDAMVCDVMMPGLDGAALRDEIAARAPLLAGRILFITGGATTPSATALLQSGVPWLEKPFDRDELRGALRRLLEPAAGG